MNMNSATLGSQWARGAAFSILLLGIWVILDLTVVPKSSLREFDPQSVARLETGMWRSYDAKERVSLFTEMAELLRTQYHFSSLRSYLGAYYAARAAVVFQRARKRPEYELALPPLRRFYGMIDGGLCIASAPTTRRAILWMRWQHSRRQSTKSRRTNSKLTPAPGPPL
jgi:hypothetical protein